MAAGTGARIAFIGLSAIIALGGAIVPAPARADDDIVAMISQYRREHGLPAVKADPRLTAVAQRQANAMAAAGELDHGVAGSFASRIANVNTDSAGENIAAGTKTWAETLRMWKASSGHNENLLRPDADIVGVAVAYNSNTRFKSYWAMEIAHRSAAAGRRAASGVVLSGPGFSAAAVPAAPEKPEKPRRASKAQRSPGFFDSLGTGLQTVTRPIRSLWN